MFDKLFDIYETFTARLVNQGWKDQECGWRETSRNTAKGSGWSLFELDNGFNLMLTYDELEEQANLRYWFNGKVDPTNVQTLEQLLQLLE